MRRPPTGPKLYRLSLKGRAKCRRIRVTTKAPTATTPGLSKSFEM